MTEIGRRRFMAASALTAPALTAAATPAMASPQTEDRRDDRRVTPGADVLAAAGWRPLAGRRVGLLTNPTGALRDHTHVVDSMVAAGVMPAAAFGPEHGFRGTAQAGGSEGDFRDPRTGIPVYDAFGASADKLAGMFTKAGVDTVVFDIADVGARFYTFIWTMYTAMRAAVATGAAFTVLDRPNPVTGFPRGPRLDPVFASGVGLKPIVQQHGMTIGELARFFDAEFLPADTGGRRLASLDIVRLRGWRRDLLFADTGLPWRLPSPNMPTDTTALLYPGLCMFEGTVFSEGRGTTRPFEIIGAPNLDWRWAERLNQLNLPGVRFRELYFAPTFSKWVNQVCGGVQVHVTDAHSVEAITTAVAMIITARQLYPNEFGWRPDFWIDKLTGSDRLRHMVDAGAGVDEVVGAWQTELADFRRQREPYLLYR